MTEVLNITHLGNPILRQKAQLIKDVSNPEVQNLIDSLIVTARKSQGVGIAAPQGGQSLRLFVVASRPNSRYPHAPEMPPTAMINPRVIRYSDKMVKDWEGCLSIPGLRGLVPRYSWIQVEFSDRAGKLQSCEFTDFVARIFQHELDHLNGVVFLDRLESLNDLYSEQEYQRTILQQSLSNPPQGNVFTEMPEGQDAEKSCL